MEFVHAGVAPTVAALVYLAGILIICWLFGRTLLFWSGAGDGMSGEERALFGTALGLVALSLALLAGGMLGALSLMSTSLILFVFIGISVFAERAKPERDYRFPVNLDEWSGRKLLICLVAFTPLLLSFIEAVAPPIGTDALSYHLTHPKIFAINQKIAAIEHSRESLWPYFTEILFTLGLVWQGTALATLFHWAFFGLTAWAIYVFANRFFTAKIGMMSGLIFLFTPAAFAQAGHAYVDLALAFFTLLSLHAFLLYDKDQRKRFCFIAGLMCGGAAGVKFLGLGTAGILFLFIILRSKLDWKAMGLFFLGCLLAGGVWYLRSWAELGNPVYPFFHEVFGGYGHSSNIAEEGRGAGIAHFFLLLWNMTFYPGAFGGEMIGPLFLMFLPFLIFNPHRLSRQGVWILSFVILSAAFLFSQSQQVRFFLSLAPVASIGAGWSLDQLTKIKSAGSRFVWALFAAVLLTHAAVYGYRARQAVAVVLERETVENYLTRRERSYKGYNYLKQNARNGEKIFNAAEPRYFYNQSPGMVVNSPGLRRSLEKKGLALTEYLDSENFDYFWLLRGFQPEIFEFVAQAGYEEVFSYQFVEKPVMFDYVILRRRAS
jgi:hypothetical protein